MRFVSTDRSIEIKISRGLGVAIGIDSHFWFFNKDGRIVDGIPPQPGKGLHIRARSPESCPGCRPYIEESYTDAKKVRQ